MFDDKMREDFLWYTYFGITKTDADNNPKKAFEKCAYRAYIDLCRTILFTKSNSSLKGDELKEYNIKKTEFKEEVISALYTKVKTIFESTNLDQFYREAFSVIIDASESRKHDLFRETLTYGQAQKWVNMTIKNMLVMGLWDFPESIEKELHIPIDSYIIDEAKKDLDIKKPSSSWSKIKDVEEYFDYQKKVREKVNYPETPLMWEHYAWINHENELLKE